MLCCTDLLSEALHEVLDELSGDQPIGGVCSTSKGHSVQWLENTDPYHLWEGRGREGGGGVKEGGRKGGRRIGGGREGGQ